MAGYWNVLSDAVARWSLQESSGSVAADSAGPNDAGLVGGLTFDVGSRAGPRAWMPRSIEFNGVDQYATLPAQSALQLGPNHSFALWCRALQSPAVDQVICDFGGSSHGTTLNLSGGAICLLTRRFQLDTFVSSPYPTDSAWTHVVGVLESNAMRLYVDGVETASATVTDPWVKAATSDSSLGACEDGHWVGGSTSGVDAYFAGQVADLSVFDRALSPAEVAELYAGPEPTLLSEPGFATPPRVTATLGIDFGDWDDHSNGETLVAIEVEHSPDGTSDWQSVAVVGPNLPAFVIPTSLGDGWLRLRAAASNGGGESAPWVGLATTVLSPDWPGVAVRGESYSPLVVAAEARPQAGPVAGISIPTIAEIAS